MPASWGDPYSTSTNSTIATPNIVWAIRASCIESTTRGRVGTPSRSRYEVSTASIGAASVGTDESGLGPGGATPECYGETVGSRRARSSSARSVAR